MRQHSPNALLGCLLRQVDLVLLVDPHHSRQVLRKVELQLSQLGLGCLLFEGDRDLVHRVYQELDSDGAADFVSFLLVIDRNHLCQIFEIRPISFDLKIKQCDGLAKLLREAKITSEAVNLEGFNQL